jgi:hypothetical protein
MTNHFDTSSMTGSVTGASGPAPVRTNDAPERTQLISDRAAVT